MRHLREGGVCPQRFKLAVLLLIAFGMNWIGLSSTAYADDAVQSDQESAQQTNEQFRRRNLRAIQAGSVVHVPAGQRSAMGGVGVVCQLLGGGGCQAPDQMGHGEDGIIGTTSDANPGAGFAAADNFTPSASGSVTEVCWWGFYNDFTPPGEDCSPGPGDDFSITYYLDVPAYPGSVPGTVVAGPFSVTPTVAATGNMVGSTPLAEYEYTATHPAVNLAIGRCYWIQIQNNTAEGNCFWLWETAPPGDGRSAQDVDDDGIFDPIGEANDYDQAFCLNIETTDTGLCIPETCGEGAGACDTPNGSPGCDDEACCNVVCNDDGFCCDVEWDSSCVNLAYGQPDVLDGLCEAPTCGAPGAGDCFEANGSVFCENLCAGDPCTGCCELVCGLDEYCCDTDWDGICAGEAMDLCGCTPIDVPPNNECIDAIPITIGVTAVSSQCATVGGPDHASCNDGFAAGLGPDVWFTFTSNFDGVLSIEPTLNEGIEWETQLAMYEGSDCAALSDPPLACATTPGGDGVLSPPTILIAPVVNGMDYIIRLGGTVDAATGTGALTLAVVPEVCADGIGDCYTAHGGPGCDITTCCVSVCSQDPDCCDIEWDQNCADLSLASCDPIACGDIDTSAATFEEPEPCSSDVNGGCNATPEAFTDIGNSVVIHGTAWADGGTRDTDWYLLPDAADADVDGDGLVDIYYNVQAELPISSFLIVDTLSDCVDLPTPGTTGYAQSCIQVQEGFAQVTLDPASRYIIFAGTGTNTGGPIFEGYPCGGDFGNDYLLCVQVVDDDAAADPSCPPGSGGCAEDLNGDNEVGIEDLLALLAAWGTDPGGPPDFNGDNEVGIEDLLQLLAAWGPC